VPLPLDIMPPFAPNTKAVGIVTEFDAFDTVEELVLGMFPTFTVKVYAAPAVSPVTVQFCEPDGGVCVLDTVQV